MEFNYLLISALLIFTTIAGIAGLFLYQNYIKKISALSVSYSSFLLFIVVISFRNGEKFNTILAVLVSVLIIFAVNLFIGFAIAKNIEK